MSGQVARRSGIVTAALLLLASAANAHVEMIPNEIRAIEFARVAFRVTHGCDKQPTTRLTIKVPEGVTLVRPQPKAAPWKISTKTIQYPEPVSLPDKVITEGFSEVTWEGGVVGADYFDDFIMVFLPPHRPGTTLRFMAVQECANTPEPEEYPLELKLSPMPQGAGAPAGHAGGGATPPAGANAAAANTDAAEGDDAAPAHATSSRLPLILGGLSILLSAIALVVALRRRA